MAGMRNGTYFDGHDRVRCRIKKIGPNNTRIVLDDGSEKLVKSTSVTVEISSTGKDSPEHLVPTVPLETFYRRLRKLQGSKEAQFQLLYDLLNERDGPKGAVFLAELFRRSVRHAESYANIDEAFCPARRKPRNSTKPAFAKRFVKEMGTNKTTQVESHTLQFVDYEIFPFRTTYSCNEQGHKASQMGSGGMDILLASNRDGVLPAIGEIKAGSEQVGPTFALIQSLMYAAQMATRNQFLRLKHHYSEAFATVNADQPRVDVIILLEANQKKLNKRDLQYAMSLADDVGELLSTFLRHIMFYSCIILNDAIKCEVISRSETAGSFSAT